MDVAILQKFFRRKPPKDLLPSKPVDTVTIDSWWKVSIGYITEDDIKVFIVFSFILVTYSYIFSLF